MASSTIDVGSPLLSYAGVATSGAATATGAATALETSLSSLAEAIAPLANQPIIGPGATALQEAVDALATSIAFVFSCIGTDLDYMGPTMQTIYRTFNTADGKLAGLFNELDELRATEGNFMVSSSLPKVTPMQAEQDLHRILSNPELQIPMASANVALAPQRNPWPAIALVGLSIGMIAALAIPGSEPVDAAAAAAASGDISYQASLENRSQEWIEQLNNIRNSTGVSDNAGN